jgi:hypothetical protein
MLIKYLDGNEAHVHPDLGRGLIAGKLATQVLTPKKKQTVPDPHWLAIRGQITSGIEDTPRIYFHCKGCGEKVYAEGPTAHLTTQIRHCNQIELVPSHIGRQYVEYRRIHDKAIVENKRQAGVKARFKFAEESTRAAART